MVRMESVTEITCYYRAFVPWSPNSAALAGETEEP
jgi:hypothetical protein